MPLEFALRPRIRLRDDFAAPPRRSRLRLPRFALPVLGYWLATAGITYALTHWHDSPEPEPNASQPVAEESITASEPAADAPLLSAPVEPEPLQAAAIAPPPAPPETPEPEPAAEPASEGAAPLSALAQPAFVARSQPRPTERSAAEPARTSGAGLVRPADHQTADDLSLALALPSTEASEPAPAPAPRVPERSRGASSLPSCEAAAAAATQDLDFASSDRTADLPSSAIAGVLENGAWLSGCGVPASTSLDVCVAIRGGRVTAATVISHPPDASLNACVKQRAGALQFPYSARLDIARTRF